MRKQYANRKAVAFGIVSYGIGCTILGVPGLYARVSAYTSWIMDITTNGKLASVAFELIEANHGVKDDKLGPVNVHSTTRRPKEVGSSTPAAETTTTTTTSTKTDESDDDFKYFDE